MFVALAGFAAGLVHVLSGPDHLAAVAPLAAGQANGQWRTGLRWGLGHTAGVLLIGLLMIALRGFLPIDALSAYSERVIGVVLLGVGALGLSAGAVAASAPARQYRARRSGSAFFTDSRAARISLVCCRRWRSRPIRMRWRISAASASRRSPA